MRLPGVLNDEQIRNNENKLVEYVSACLMSGRSERDIKANLETIAEGVENIRKDYRNPSAHTNSLRRINAKECFDLVLDVAIFRTKTLLDE